MTILFRYIVREIARCFSMCLAGAMAVYLVVDFFEKTRHFLKYDVQAADLCLYLLLRIPDISLTLVPLVVLMATILAISILYRNNEIMAMRSCGISLWRVTLPCVAFALVISLVFFFIDVVIAPISNLQAKNIKIVRIEKKELPSTFNPGPTWIHTGPDTFMSVESVEAKGTLLKGVALYRLDSDFQLLEAIKAKEAHFLRNGWELRNGIKRKLFADGRVQKSGFETRPIVLPHNQKISL